MNTWQHLLGLLYIETVIKVERRREVVTVHTAEETEFTKLRLVPVGSQQLGK